MRACLTVTCLWLVIPAQALASDFWEEVRIPGLSAYRSLLAQGERALTDNNFDDALDFSRRASTRLPEQPDAHVLRGRVLSAMQRYEDAAEAYSQALARDRAALDAPTVATVAADHAAWAGRFALAVEILVRAVGRSKPGSGRAALYTLLGDMRMCLGPPGLGAATAAYRQALTYPAESRRDKRRALLGLALARHRAGYPQEARELARRAIGGALLEVQGARWPLPRGERSARLAVGFWAIGDEAAAARSFKAVPAGSPWYGHAQAALREEPPQ